jgi:leucyl-tRNA synthetase
MSEYDPQELEPRWRERWAEEGHYEADPADAADGDDDPTFITVPYPYPSGGMHIGHSAATTSCFRSRGTSRARRSSARSSG